MTAQLKRFMPILSAPYMVLSPHIYAQAQSNSTNTELQLLSYAAGFQSEYRRLYKGVANFRMSAIANRHSASVVSSAGDSFERDWQNWAEIDIRGAAGAFEKAGLDQAVQAASLASYKAGYFDAIKSPVTDDFDYIYSQISHVATPAPADAHPLERRRVAIALYKYADTLGASNAPATDVINKVESDE